MSAFEDWRAVARVEDLPEGGLVGVKVDDRDLVLHRRGEQVHAFDDRCPHRGAPFTEVGYVSDGKLTCGWHYWQFELGSGRHCHVPSVRVPMWRVRLVHGVVEVDVAAPVADDP